MTVYEKEVVSEITLMKRQCTELYAHYNFVGIKSVATNNDTENRK